MRRSAKIVLVGAALAQCVLCAAVVLADTDVFLLGVAATQAKVRQRWSFPPCQQWTRTQNALIPTTVGAYPWFIPAVSVQNQHLNYPIPSGFPGGPNGSNPTIVQCT